MFGSPKAGGRRLKKCYNKLRQKHDRYVHSDDIVPLTPPKWFGYVHLCESLNLDDANGEYLLDIIQDHDMAAYLKALNTKTKDSQNVSLV